MEKAGQIWAKAPHTRPLCLTDAPCAWHRHRHAEDITPQAQGTRGAHQNVSSMDRRSPTFTSDGRNGALSFVSIGGNKLSEDTIPTSGISGIMIGLHISRKTPLEPITPSRLIMFLAVKIVSY